ncbi:MULTISPECIES: Na+/H+ antiporter NhaA [Paraclostridium]|uniref:Na+/H+ antiporter NhaA n=1 Tax=Paraclostridium TaxID=1849822 RepID=UPI002FCD2DF6|nr:Na+/H+ antiporter NhaA [Paraclostridium sp. AKS81]
MCATIISITLANSPFSSVYHHLLGEFKFLGHFNIHMLVNDFLMAIFFLLVGLEIKHELLYGNLSSFKKASFPIFSALGGVIVPAIIFMVFNKGTQFEAGVGIPISTDIAFAVGIFMILKNKLNPALKIFLLSLAVVDDLISIFVIGFLYSSNINFKFLYLALFFTCILIYMNIRLRINKIYPYLIIGFFIWGLIYLSGVHATISGVLIAISIPSTKLRNEKKTISYKLEHKLSPLCNLFILPLFALANTAITLNLNIDISSSDTLIKGIIAGLSIGKPLGIMTFAFIATMLGLTEKPKGSTWLSIFSVSILAGVGFTMSIFISEIAFANNPEFVSIAKISILLASLISIISTYIIATFASKNTAFNKNYTFKHKKTA